MNDTEYMTVSAFAKAVGTTNQAIYQQLDKRLKPYFKVIDNKKMVSIQAIQDIYKKSVDKENKSTEQLNSQELINSLKEHIQDLQNQLSVANAEKQEKDKQIADLTETIKSLGQSINARNHTELAEKLETKMLDDGSAKPRQGFFSRLFGKGKMTNE